MMNTYTLIRRDGIKTEVPFLFEKGKYLISEHLPQFENRAHTLGFAQHDTGAVVIYQPLVTLFETVRTGISLLRGEDTPITVSSGYRSREYQVAVYEADLRANSGKPSGKVARPGHSPHETGAAMDLELPKGFGAKEFAAFIRRVSLELQFPEARTGYVIYDYKFVHVDLVPMLYRPYTGMPNPNPGVWKPGVIW
jgi:hypothetical protein